jgi:hypothetical protein
MKPLLEALSWQSTKQNFFLAQYLYPSWHIHRQSFDVAGFSV